MLSLFKRHHKELDRVSITYEPRIRFDQKYELALAKFDIPKDLLLNFPGFPFGGFVRDTFHSDTPKDLDLFFISAVNIRAVAKFLKQKGWVSQESRRIDSWKWGSYSEIIRRKSGYVKCFTKHGQKIDLFFKYDMISAKEELVLLAQAYAWDLSLDRFFLWADPVSEGRPSWKEDHLQDTEDSVFKQLSSKKLELNRKYASWLTIKDTEAIRIQSEYLKEKIQSLLQKGWDLELGKSNIFGNRLLLPKAKVEIIKMLPEKTVRAHLSTYLTHASPKTRLKIKDILRDYHPEIVANFLHKRNA